MSATELGGKGRIAEEEWLDSLQRLFTDNVASMHDRLGIINRAGLSALLKRPEDDPERQKIAREIEALKTNLRSIESGFIGLPSVYHLEIQITPTGYSKILQDSNANSRFARQSITDEVRYQLAVGEFLGEGEDRSVIYLKSVTDDKSKNIPYFLFGHAPKNPLSPIQNSVINVREILNIKIARNRPAKTI